MQLAASSYHKVICWQQDTPTEYYLVTADYLIKYLGGFEEEVSLMSLRNGIQSAQFNALSADLPRFEETSVCGIKSSWKIKGVEGKEGRGRKCWLLGITWLLNTSLLDPRPAEVFEADSPNPAGFIWKVTKSTVKLHALLCGLVGSPGASTSPTCGSLGHEELMGSGLLHLFLLYSTKMHTSKVKSLFSYNHVRFKANPDLSCGWMDRTRSTLFKSAKKRRYLLDSMFWSNYFFLPQGLWGI